MREKCLAQEHNAVPKPGLEPGPLDLESGALTIRPLHLPTLISVFITIFILKKKSGAFNAEGKIKR